MVEWLATATKYLTFSEVRASSKDFFGKLAVLSNFVICKYLKILLKQASKLHQSLVVGIFVFPSIHWVEDLRWHAFNLCRDLQTKHLGLDAVGSQEATRVYSIDDFPSVR